MKAKAAEFGLVISTWRRGSPIAADMQRIARRVGDIDGSIDARTISHHRIDQWRLLPFWAKPTLSLALVQRGPRKLLPGRYLTGRQLGKIGEYERLGRAGVPVPEWTAIGPDTRLDPAHWGPYVVEKPSMGRLGAFVRVRRTSRIAHVPPDDLPPDHHGRLGPMLAQRFIYTGEWPTSYRVVTLFGEVLFCYRQTTRGRGSPLKGRWDFRGGGITIVSNTLDMQVEADADAEVIALAEHAHRAAFGDLALLSFDIVRDAETAELFVLECHPRGSGWGFANRTGRGIQEKNGVDLEKQFDGIEKAARILAAMTPKLALRRSPFGAEEAPVWWSALPPPAAAQEPDTAGVPGSPRSQ